MAGGSKVRMRRRDAAVAGLLAARSTSDGPPAAAVLLQLSPLIY